MDEDWVGTEFGGDCIDRVVCVPAFSDRQWNKKARRILTQWSQPWIPGILTTSWVDSCRERLLHRIFSFIDADFRVTDEEQSTPVALLGLREIWGHCHIVPAALSSSGVAMRRRRQSSIRLYGITQRWEIFSAYTGKALQYPQKMEGKCLQPQCYPRAFYRQLQKFWNQEVAAAPDISQGLLHTLIPAPIEDCTFEPYVLCEPSIKRGMLSAQAGF